MKEIIVQVAAYSADYPKAPIYVADLIPCGECRYCKKKRGTFKGEPIIFYRCTENNRDVEADDFCSWGERGEQ